MVAQCGGDQAKLFPETPPYTTSRPTSSPEGTVKQHSEKFGMFWMYWMAIRDIMSCAIISNIETVSNIVPHLERHACYLGASLGVALAAGLGKGLGFSSFHQQYPL